MQKVLTLSLNVNSLMENSDTENCLNEIPALNAYLELGWHLEEWEVIKTDEVAGKMLLWIVLTDEFETDADDFEDEIDDSDFDSN